MREMVGVPFVTHGKLRPYACMVMALERERGGGEDLSDHLCPPSP